MEPPSQARFRPSWKLLRSLEARSTQPSLMTVLTRPSAAQPLALRPLFHWRLVRKVLKLPPPTIMEPPASSAMSRVFREMVAPKAPAPSVDVPTPRCTWMSSVALARSGMLTQKTACDSLSLIGMPLSVTLMRVGSVPRMRRPV